MFELNKIVFYFHNKCDASSLAFARITIGLLLLIDMVYERGLSKADLIWGDTNQCRFPLFDGLYILPFRAMCALYAIMCFGIIGITIGLKYRLSCVAYATCYWYIFLVDKSRWNNHSYLFGLMSLLFLVSDAHFQWSFDYCILNKSNNKKVPFWQYFLLRTQLFLVYFIAGIKKLNSDWLNGHSMTFLSEHWIFDIFRNILTNDNIDLIIVHWGGLLFDLTVGFLLVLNKTRNMAFVLSLIFHLMNSHIFSIGMFPYVMIATMPLFCSPDWPKALIKKLLPRNEVSLSERKILDQTLENKIEKSIKTTFRQRFTVVLLICYLTVQTFLPFSHSISKGYNTWTNGLYGYSWDMMVHNWNHIHTTITVIDESKQKYYFDPQVWTRSERWTHHSDMVKQFCKCANEKLIRDYKMKDPSIYIDTWVSLNRRFAQRIYDPNVNIVKAEWSAFEKPVWVLPLMTDLSEWQHTIKQYQQFYDNQNSSVVFIADFPGLTLNNYIEANLVNTTLIILNGWIKLEIEGVLTRIMSKGDHMQLIANRFNRITTIKSSPACYMIVYETDANHSQLNQSNQSHKTTPFYDKDVKGITKYKSNYYEERVAIESATEKKNAWLVSLKFIWEGIIAILEATYCATHRQNCTKPILLY